VCALSLSEVSDALGMLDQLVGLVGAGWRFHGAGAGAGALSSAPGGAHSGLVLTAPHNSTHGRCVLVCCELISALAEVRRRVSDARVVTDSPCQTFHHPPSPPLVIPLRLLPPTRPRPVLSPISERVWVRLCSVG
jgi:hypothetical protein